MTSPERPECPICGNIYLDPQAIRCIRPDCNGQYLVRRKSGNHQGGVQRHPPRRDRSNPYGGRSSYREHRRISNRAEFAASISERPRSTSASTGRSRNSYRPSSNQSQPQPQPQPAVSAPKPPAVVGPTQVNLANLKKKKAEKYDKYDRDNKWCYIHHCPTPGKWECSAADQTSKNHHIYVQFRSYWHDISEEDERIIKAQVPKNAVDLIDHITVLQRQLSIYETYVIARDDYQLDILSAIDEKHGVEIACTVASWFCTANIATEHHLSKLVTKLYEIRRDYVIMPAGVRMRRESDLKDDSKRYVADEVLPWLQQKPANEIQLIEAHYEVAVMRIREVANELQIDLLGINRMVLNEIWLDPRMKGSSLIRLAASFISEWSLRVTPNMTELNQDGKVSLNFL